MAILRRSFLALPALLVARPAWAANPIRLVVEKSARKLRVVSGDVVLRSFAIALGPHPRGQKVARGDGATPEGEYYVTHHNPKSRYHLSLGLSYPNREDARRGLARGLVTRDEVRAITDALDRGERPPQDTRLGGDLFVHGGGTAHDWTLGCIALANDDVDTLYDAVPRRARVTILP